MNIDSEHESQLPWTGERYVPQITGEIQLEHIHRYILAQEYAKDKDVLDIACGEGYGSAILGAQALSVIGVDISEEAISHARATYTSPKLHFEVGSCEQVPLADASVDAVVCFETLEHVAAHDHAHQADAEQRHRDADEQLGPIHADSARRARGRP